MYEQIKAIGTGKTAYSEQPQELNGKARNWIESKLCSYKSK